MATVEFILALERRMEIVPLRKGWWIAFGAPHQTAAAQGDSGRMSEPGTAEVLGATSNDSADAPAVISESGRPKLGLQRDEPLRSPRAKRGGS